MSQQRAIRQCGCLPCQQQLGSEVAGEHAAINRVVATLDERRRRLVVGCLAAQWGRGGITRLAQITGLSRNTIVRGQRELAPEESETAGRLRRPGGGRKRIEKKSPACRGPWRSC